MNLICSARQGMKLKGNIQNLTGSMGKLNNPKR